MVAARHLPDVEGLGGGVGQEAEHQDDGVGVGKTVRVDLSVRETKRGCKCVGCRTMWVRLRAGWGLTPQKNPRRRLKSYVKTNSISERRQRGEEVLPGDTETQPAVSSDLLVHFALEKPVTCSGGFVRFLVRAQTGLHATQLVFVARANTSDWLAGLAQG